jgi:hypothetical protein
MSSLQQQRLITEQLRREANLKRISISQAIEDIKVLYSRVDRTWAVASEPFLSPVRFLETTITE